jgi:hypothetical protein
MADPLCHVAQGGLMLVLPFISRIRRTMWIWVLGIVGGVLGALPDLIGAFGMFILKDGSRLYNSAHAGTIKNLILFIPMCWVHLKIDPHMHDPSLRWHGLSIRVTLEIALWLANFLMIYLSMWMWRWSRNKTSLIPSFPEESA